MIKQTFIHIPGIGNKTEQKLWANNIVHWSDWQDPLPCKLSITTRIDGPKILSRSFQALDNDPAYFTKYLPGHETWRIFPEYRSSTAYLDIETTGLHDFAEITTIALYDGQEIRTYVNGINLDNFIDDIYQYNVLVTYNGKSFDIPFIEKFFQISLDHAQIDLRYVLAKLGFKGGLKGCEKQIGIDRGELQGVDGYFAVLLWDQYKKYNDERALDTLLAYNIEDTVNLERLAIEAYNRRLATTPFYSDLQIDPPKKIANPYTPDLDCVDTIKNSYLQKQRNNFYR